MSSLDTKQMLILQDNLDENGRLSCLKAFKVAKLLGIKPIKKADTCKNENIKITSCELGVFGKIAFETYEEDIYKNIKQHYKNNTQVTCKTLWKEAQSTSLRRVGSTVKNSDVDVIYCQLGCFRKKLGHANKS